MKALKRTICMLLLCTVLFSAVVLPANAVNAVDDNTEIGTLEEMALDYVEKYVQEIMFYDSEDLRTDTIRTLQQTGEASMSENLSNSFSSLSFTMDGEAKSFTTLCDSVTVWSILSAAEAI